MPVEPWPRAGQRVGVQVENVRAMLVAVVDDVRAPEQLHLREPVEVQGVPVPEIPLGTPVTLTWTSAAGQHVLLSMLTSMPEARVRLWRLEPATEPVVLQRREYVRVPETLRVRLLRDGTQWEAGLCDLSEGGARCVVLTPNDLMEGDLVQLLLAFDVHRLDLPACVLGVERDAERTMARLRFDGIGREADLLRRRVLEQQRLARAAGLR